MPNPKHPAKFSPSVTALMAELIRDEARDRGKRIDKMRTLDPFAGVGLVHQLPGKTFGIELEPEWANMHPRTQVGDARHLPWRRNSFDVIATSPTYGNRFADHHNAQDGSTRRSYTHDLGRRLTPGNTGEHYFRNGQKREAPYRVLHRAAWAEAARVLRPVGVLLLNVSDFVNRGEVQRVEAWHAGELMLLGFELVDARVVDTPRLRYGANHEARVDGERVLVFRAPTESPL